ncbi:hypothetical protein BDB01DRAFT_749702 [Pilobolus umbonatus]|nr:hypothetical protein BDB01DRAFT_749702 [Pilobolus umbonatus]
MDKTLTEYDENLKELERQQEQLKLVMKKMDQEWEESGAGIGWLGSLDFASGREDTSQSESISNIINDNPYLLHKQSDSSQDILSLNHIAPFTDTLHTSSCPSPEYLHSLLNVNEALLAQSMANTSLSTPVLTPPATDRAHTMSNISNTFDMLVTPEDEKYNDDTTDNKDTQSGYSTMSPNIITPLESPNIITPRNSNYRSLTLL